MRNFISAALLGLLFLFGAPAQSFADSGAKTASHATGHHRVVFQVSDNDPQKWNLTLNNVNNMQKALGKDNVTIEVVAYGPGVNMLKMDSKVGPRISEAVANGVKIVACQNTMHGMHLTKEDMLSEIGYVPGGVIELMERQEQGYAYIRP